MSRPSRFAAILALVTLATAGTPLARAEESSEKSSSPPNYQNPVVALLFLPVTVLLKIAEVVSPDAKRSERSDDTSEK